MTPRRSHVSKFLLLPFLFLGGCSHEEHATGETKVLVNTPEPQRMVGLHKVLLDGKQVGWVQTWKVDGSVGTREVKRVVDMDKRPLGWMDDMGRAFRQNPHGGDDVVGTTRDERGRVRAILGMPSGRLDLVDITR